MYGGIDEQLGRQVSRKEHSEHGTQVLHSRPGSWKHLCTVQYCKLYCPVHYSTEQYTKVQNSRPEKLVLLFLFCSVPCICWCFCSCVCLQTVASMGFADEVKQLDTALGSAGKALKGVSASLPASVLGPHGKERTRELSPWNGLLSLPLFGGSLWPQIGRTFVHITRALRGGRGTKPASCWHNRSKQCAALILGSTCDWER